MTQGRSGDAPPPPRVRMQDVATAAAVDTSVVSRVLSGDATLNVRPETRRRVLDAVQRLGYQPNAAARALKTARTMALGMLLPDLANTVYAEIARGAEERASAAGYILVIATGTAAARRAVLAGRVDGVLYAIATTENVAAIRPDPALPSLLVNRREPGAGPSVIVDDEAGVATAVRHLLDLGHTRIAHIGGPHAVDTARRRLAGYERALRERGMPVQRELVAEARFDERGGATAAARLLLLDPPPTALVVANVSAAIGAMATARDAGLEIPRDLSVIGFHDVPMAPYLAPPLTTVRMPLAELGSRAVDSLLAMIDGHDVGDVVVSAAPELVLRGSSAPPFRRGL
jgi:LacI family transcriptional regulator